MKKNIQGLGATLLLPCLVIGCVVWSVPSLAGKRLESRATSLPYSVSSISEENVAGFGDVPSIRDLTQSVPGITLRGGAPVAVRGFGGSINSDPIVIINGQLATGSLGTLDPTLVEQVEVLNGNAATALYGTRGQDGIILVTTREEFRPANPIGSAALPSTLSVLGDYTLAIESRQHCDATSGNGLPIPAWQPRHDYGVGRFSPDLNQQYWGSQERGFDPALLRSRLPVANYSFGGAKLFPNPAPKQVSPYFESFVSLMMNPQLANSDYAVFVTALMFLHRTINSVGAEVAAEQDIANAEAVVATVMSLTSGLPQLATMEFPPARAERDDYTILQEIIERLQSDPALPAEIKIRAVLMLLFGGPLHTPMLSNDVHAVGLFNPDTLYNSAVANANSENLYDGLQSVVDRLAADPDIGEAGAIRLVLPLIFTAGVDQRLYSDAAAALGLFNPEALYAWLSNPANTSYMAMNTLETFELIDPYEELFESWVSAYSSILNDTSLSAEARSFAAQGILYYMMSISLLAAETPAALETFDFEALLTDFYANTAVMNTAAYADSDPFAEYDLPPLSAFDSRWCSPEQWELMKSLIRRRDANNDTVNQLWDYYRRPDTSRTDGADALADAFDAEARREEYNLAMQQLWMACTRQDLAAEFVEEFIAENGLDTEIVPGIEVPEPEIDIVVVETGPDGDLTDVPVPGLNVSLTKIDFTREFMLPFMPLAEYDYELHAGLGTSRRFTDATGTARGAPTESDQSARPNSPLDNSPWQIRADYERNRIGVKVGYTKIDSVVQTVPVDLIPRDPASPDQFLFDSIVPSGLSPYLESGMRVGNVFGLTYAYPESAELDFGAMLQDSPFELHDNTCGESAWLPQAHVARLLDTASTMAVAAASTQVEAASPGDTTPTTVAIVDTGIDWNHQDLSWDNLWRNEGEIPDNGVDDDQNGYVDDIIGWDFTGNTNTPWDNDGHGTFVAGLIAARVGNDIGIDGINPDARIMVLKALNNFGRTRASFLAEAITYAADNGARVINISVAGSDFPPLVQAAIDYANSRDSIVVMAAGNGGINLDASRPGPLEDVVLVAATGDDDRHAAFSNTGSAISLAARGADVVSLRARATDFMYAFAETSYEPGTAFVGDDSRYYRSAGTSFAAPVVAGAASLLLSERPSLSRAEVIRILEQSARDVGAPGRDPETGYGVVDIDAARQTDPGFFVEASIDSIRYVPAADGPYLELVGTADADLFAVARIESGSGADPESFDPVDGLILDRVKGGVLTRVPYSAFAGQSTSTLRLVVEHATGRTREVRRTITLDPTATGVDEAPAF